MICLHGTSGHLEAFTRNIEAAVNAGFTVHALDMLGHGYTDKPDFDYTPPQHVDHLRAYIRTQGLDRPHLIGESLGGWVSAWLAADHPDEVGRLILVAPGGTAATPEVMAKIKQSTEAAVLNASLDRTRQRLELLMHDPRQVTDELVQVRHAIYTQDDFRTALAHILCLQDLPTRTRYLLDKERLGRISTPTLLIWGRQNPFGKTAEAFFIRDSIPGCRLELFDECGHWPQYEKADQFNDLAWPFLTGDGGQH
ncbi:alpha/beta fold hydrolase [Micromonospora craniellae]|uniref:alpha/beta fold hydrolase n=1 Tax=Micromonospora craniellae TaxID=2294034 RepID=UPI0018F1616F|nr:alpha/beta fold hydrolase [Micromonospora craniellae]